MVNLVFDLSWAKLSLAELSTEELSWTKDVLPWVSYDQIRIWAKLGRVEFGQTEIGQAEFKMQNKLTLCASSKHKLNTCKK